MDDVVRRQAELRAAGGAVVVGRNDELGAGIDLLGVLHLRTIEHEHRPLIGGRQMVAGEGVLV